jgi:hypothetical protein
MDGKPPTHDELLDPTRRQARPIDELRAEVGRLKAASEQSRRAGKRGARRPMVMICHDPGHGFSRTRVCEPVIVRIVVTGSIRKGQSSESAGRLIDTPCEDLNGNRACRRSTCLDNGMKAFKHE